MRQASCRKGFRVCCRSTRRRQRSDSRPMISAVEWIGGARFPGPGGWSANASSPFAVLSLDDGNLSLRLRWLARLLGKRPLECSVDALELAFPCSGMFGDGVGFRTDGGTEIYFWTAQGDEILSALKRLGVPVSSEPRRVRLRP